MLKLLKQIPDPAVSRSLGLSILDGASWALMFGLAENYIVPFALFFGATVFEIGVLQGFSLMANGFGQLSGAVLVHKTHNRKQLSRVSVVLQAVCWVFIFLFTFLTKSPWMAVILYCVCVFFGNIGSPGWNSWMNDLVPAEKRGVFWAGRNTILGFIQLGAIVAAGIVLELSHKGNWEVVAFGVLFCMAFVTRMGSFFFLARQHDPKTANQAEEEKFSFLTFLKSLKGTWFGSFVLLVIVVNFSINLINPIIQVQLLKNLKMDYISYTAITMTATIAAFVFMTYWGPLSDRFGNRRILMVTTAALPFMALGWIFARDIWWLIPLQLLSGFLVSGFNLATTNYIFDSMPPAKMTKIMAYFTTVNMTAGFLGATSGGALAQVLSDKGWHWGILDPFTTVFLLAVIIRFIAFFVWARKFPEVRPTEPSPGLKYFYFTKPVQDFSSFIISQSLNVKKAVKKVTRIGRR